MLAEVVGLPFCSPVPLSIGSPVDDAIRDVAVLVVRIAKVRGGPQSLRGNLLVEALRGVQTQAGQGCLRLPRADFDSRSGGFGTVNDQAQFVAAGRQGGRNVKKIESVDRLTRRPAGCRLKVQILQQMVLMVLKNADGIVEAEGQARNRRPCCSARWN